MDNKQLEREMKEEQKFFGVNPGFKLMTPGAFAGLNQSSSRMMMKDEEFFWIENFIKTGDGALRTLWDKGTPIYTAPNGKIIIYFYFFNIGPTNYVAVFLNDGTAIQVNTSTLVNVSISSAANTFYNSSLSTQPPACGQWGSNYLLICNNFSTNNYWVWDGFALHNAGTLGPSVTLTASGSGYTSAPTVTAFGGSGTGATFLATVVSGSVVSIQVTNPGTGYEPGDEPQLLITGGGSDSGAELVATITAGAISSVVVTNPGSGYTNGTYALGFSGGGGTGATGTYTVTGNQVTSTTITAGGSGYTSTPTVSFPSGGGSNASGAAQISAGSLTGITIINGGSGFSTTPTLTVSGGGGTGATAIVTVLTSGVITGLGIPEGGSGYTSPPTIAVETGLNRAASGTIEIMPYGVSGSSIETFQSRVWIMYPYQAVIGAGVQQNGGIFNVSSPGSFTDFNDPDGALTFTSTDAFLRAQYTAVKQSNGYLYPIADSSVSVISNVQTSGSPTSTTFNYQNTDPQIGTSWRDSCQAFSRTIIFGNQFGLFGLYGGSVTKISTKVDNLFTAATVNGVYTGTFNPSSAVANIYSKKVYLFLFTTVDPTTQATRTVMLSWDEKDFSISSQTANLTFIGTQEVNSNLTAYGTDGASLYPLFNTPSTSLTKKLSTKLYGANNALVQKESLGVYFQVQDKSSNLSGVAMNSVTVDSETGSYNIPKIASFPTNSGVPYNPVLSMGSGDVFGTNLGLTITTSSADFVLEMLGLGMMETGTIAMGTNLLNTTEATE